MYYTDKLLKGVIICTILVLTQLFHYQLLEAKVYSQKMYSAFNSPTVLKYNASMEVTKRQERLQAVCKDHEKGIQVLKSRSYMLSRFGVSTGNIPFWTCIPPKCASSSLSATLLMATGFFPPEQRNNITWKMWDIGRNHCDRVVPRSKTCLWKFKVVKTTFDC